MIGQFPAMEDSLQIRVCRGGFRGLGIDGSPVLASSLTLRSPLPHRQVQSKRKWELWTESNQAYFFEMVTLVSYAVPPAWWWVVGGEW